MKPGFLRSIFFLLSFFISSIQAQQFPDTSLVRLSEIIYGSAFEQESFNKLLKNTNTGYFELFICNDPIITSETSENYQSNFLSTISKFKTDYYQQMNEKKKIQKIYSSIHEEMLEKYTPLVPFSSIFLSKEYHCVSSSMLYALAFEELGIPYEIKVIPTHVYLVAYPLTAYITVETTDPLSGTIIYDQTFKAKFVDFLRDSKLISKEEYFNKDVETLFKEYYNKTKTTDLRGLASIQYKNQTLHYLEEVNYHRALECQEKAWFLNPDTLNTYLLFISLITDYAQLDKNDVQCAAELGKLSRFTGKGITSEEITVEFAQITQRQLLYEGDYQMYDSSYHTVISFISDSSLRDEISFIYFYEKGRVLCNQLEFEQAIPYTQKAFQIKPRNSDARNNLLLAVNNTMETMEPVKRLELVNRIALEVPSLLEDNIFAQLRLSIYLMLMDMFYYDRDAEKGEEYMRQFEALYPVRISKYQYLESDIARAYGTAASYYFRLGQTNKTRAVLEKGLEYAPGSYDLKNRLNSIK